MRLKGIVCGVIFACFAVFWMCTESSSVGIEVETVEVQEHDNLTLACNSSSIPDANLTDYFWIRNSTDGTSTSALYATTQTLNFVHVLENVSAVYTCHALDTLIGDNVTVRVVNVDVLTPEQTTGTTVTIYLVVGCCAAGVFMILMFWSAFSRARIRTYRSAGSDALVPQRERPTERWRSLRSVFGGSSHMGSSWRPHDGSYSASYTDSTTKPHHGSFVWSQSHNAASSKPHIYHHNSDQHSQRDVKGTGSHMSSHVISGKHGRIAFNDVDNKPSSYEGIAKQSLGGEQRSTGTKNAATLSSKADQGPPTSTRSDGRSNNSPFSGPMQSTYGNTLGGRPHKGYQNDGYENDNAVDDS